MASVLLGLRMKFKAGLMAGAMALAAAPAVAAPAFDVYDGACDASGAVALPDDRFLLADNNTNALRIYRIGKPAPEATIPVADFLGVKKDKEADLEATARIGDRIYVISSHGLNSRAEKKEQRYRLFAVAAADGAPIRTLGHPYILLAETMMADPAYQALLADAENRPPEEGGINIEGLAEGPDGSLYAGFRSPAAAESAIVMPIRNPGKLVDAAPALTTGEDEGDRLARARAATDQADLGPPIVFTTLGGLGIRSLEKVGDHYLIVAGPPGAGSDFRLFRWSGKPQDQPEPVADRTIDFDDALMMRPEAIFAQPDGSLYLLSDDGDYVAAQNAENGEPKKCEKLPDTVKHFRGFALPAVE
jgi:hypothetical protein